MKRKLTPDEMVTFFAVMTHCDKKILIDNPSLTKFTEITCPECEEPIMFRGSNGSWYKADERIFK